MISLQKTILGFKAFDRRIYVFIGAFVLLFCFDALAIHFSLYYFHRWVDIPVHIGGGLLLAILFYYIVFANSYSRALLHVTHSYKNIFLTMVVYVFGTAVVWEIFEYIIGRTYMSPRYIPDTTLDIFSSVCGAIMAYGIVFGWRIYRQRHELEK